MKTIRASNPPSKNQVNGVINKTFTLNNLMTRRPSESWSPRRPSRAPAVNHLSPSFGALILLRNIYNAHSHNLTKLVNNAIGYSDSIVLGFELTLWLWTSNVRHRWKGGGGNPNIIIIHKWIFLQLCLKRSFTI